MELGSYCNFPTQGIKGSLLLFLPCSPGILGDPAESLEVHTCKMPWICRGFAIII